MHTIWQRNEWKTTEELKMQRNRFSVILAHFRHTKSHEKKLTYKACHSNVNNNHLHFTYYIEYNIEVKVKSNFDTRMLVHFPAIYPKIIHIDKVLYCCYSKGFHLCFKFKSQIWMNEEHFPLDFWLYLNPLHLLFWYVYFGWLQRNTF